MIDPLQEQPDVHVTTMSDSDRQMIRAKEAARDPGQYGLPAELCKEDRQRLQVADVAPLTLREEPMQHRNLTARSVTVRADTLDEEARSVEAVLTTEQTTPVFDFRTFSVIDEVLLMRGLTPVGQVVLLESHNRSTLESLLGSVREIRVTGTIAVGRLFLATGDTRADAAWNKIRQGHLTDVSIGYRVAKFVDIPAGQTQTVEGRQFTAGARTLRITTQFEIKEASLVPIGADSGAKLREEPARTAGHGVKTMNPKLRKYLETIGLRSDATDGDALAYLSGLSGEQKQRADELASESPPAVPVPPPEPVREAVTPPVPAPAATPPVDPTPAPERSAAADEAVRVAERQRIESIRSLAGDDVPAELLNRAINEGWQTDRAGTAFLQSIRDARQESVGAPAVHSANLERDGGRDALAAGMLIRSGLTSVPESGTDAQRAEAARNLDRGRRFADLSMMDIVRESLRCDGISVPHGRDAMIHRALSGGTLSFVFTTNVNAAVMSGFAETEDSTMGWTAERDVNDFKQNDDGRLEKIGALDRLPRGETAKDAVVSDAVESWKLIRYAKKWTIDEQDIIDDRLDMLNGMPALMGAAAARLRPDLVYSLLLANANMRDAVALFHASHGNLQTGGASVLAAAGLQTGLEDMAKQTENGANLNVKAAYLVVPQDLAFTAQILLHSAERRDSTTTAAGTLNPLQGLPIAIRADNRIGAAGTIDPVDGTSRTGTATNWFLFANPGAAPTIVVGFLGGRGRAPRIRPYQLDQGKWGLGWDIVHDIGAKALDWRGVYKSNGA